MVNSANPALRVFAARALRSLLRQRCQICDAATHGALGLCAICHLLIKKQRLERSQGCVSCALPLPAAESGLFCAWCVRQRPVFERCIAATAYAPASARLVNGLKHYRQLPAANIIAAEMARAVTATIGRDALREHIDVVVPVPLHRRRLRERGFNQAVQISRPLCRALELPLDTGACSRIHDARAQQALSRRQRAQNLRNAFACNQRVAGMRVAIVDDVVTTTSTANAVARSLLDAGAVGCEVWCFARTPAPD